MLLRKCHPREPFRNRSKDFAESNKDWKNKRVVKMSKNVEPNGEESAASPKRQYDQNRKNEQQK